MAGGAHLVIRQGPGLESKSMPDVCGIGNPEALREFQAESNPSHYRARYYDQTTGRFLSEDPIRFQSDGNFYGYTGNGPLNWFDPFGLDWIRYTGQTLTVYGGSFGDTSQTLQTCNATSGERPLQSPKYQHTEGGRVPEGKWRINLGLDPARPVRVNQDSSTKPAFGVQLIGPGSEDWGTWRARLEKVSVHDSRDNTF